LSSGVADRLETTTTFSPDQYIFMSVTGGGTYFVQKDVNSDDFIPRNSNIPPSPITIIRVDDSM